MTRKEGIEMIRRCYRHNEECYVAEEKVGAERAQKGRRVMRQGCGAEGKYRILCQPKQDDVSLWAGLGGIDVQLTIGKVDELDCG